MFENINYIELLACGVAAMVVGFFWYGNMLFGKMWQKEAHVSDADIKAGQKEAPKMYGLMFVGALIQAFVLSIILDFAQAFDLMSGVQVAFWVWLGFIATTRMADVLFERKSTTLFGINVGYSLVTLVVMSAIIVSL
jgi:hypothetical protein